MTAPISPTGNRSTFDSSPAAESISSLLATNGSHPSSWQDVELKPGISGLHSSDFPTLDEFKQIYLATQRPVLCFIHPLEVSEVTRWLRPTDDIALIGEPEELTQWRLHRIVTSLDQRLDSLTQVFCREELISVLKPMCKSASPFLPASIILADVDGMKSLNDHFGIPAGDSLLKQVGTLLKSVCQPAFIARTRGGEFGILLNANLYVAKQVATIVRDTINQCQWEVVERVTFSFGVASVFSASTPSLLLTQADEALFAAKANGRDQVVCYSEIAEVSQADSDQVAVISLENKARVLSERVTSFVTQQSKRIMRTLHREATTDGLTQLFNRRYLDKQLGEEFNFAIANQAELCLALIDLDHFGEINKTYGWPTGDKVLCDVAESISRSIRANDWVGRYGGEEICIVMPGTSLENAKVICERVRSSVETKIFQSTSDQPIHVTVSIGLAELDDQSDRTVESLVERVSQLTLRAKSSGRNQVGT